MGLASLCQQPGPLGDAEALLFIHHHQRQIGKFYPVVYQRMSADYQPYFTTADAGGRPESRAGGRMNSRYRVKAEGSSFSP